MANESSPLGIESPMQGGTITALVSLGNGPIETLPLLRPTLKAVRDALKDSFGLDAAAADLRITADLEGIAEVASDEQLFMHIRSQQVLYVHTGRGTVVMLEQQIGRLRQFQSSAMQREVGQLRHLVERMSLTLRELKGDMLQSQRDREASDARVSEQMQQSQASDAELRKALDSVNASLAALRQQVESQLVTPRLTDSTSDGRRLSADVDRLAAHRRLDSSEEWLVKLQAQGSSRDSDLRQMRAELSTLSMKCNCIPDVQQLHDKVCRELAGKAEETAVLDVRKALQEESESRKRLERALGDRIALLEQRVVDDAVRVNVHDGVQGADTFGQEQLLLPGMQARVSRLEKQPELNGTIVTLCSFLESQQPPRWEVVTKDGDRRFHCKPENLELLSQSAGHSPGLPAQGVQRQCVYQKPESPCQTPHGRPQSLSPDSRPSTRKQSASPLNVCHLAAQSSDYVPAPSPSPSVPPLVSAATQPRLGVMLAPAVLPPEATVDQMLSRQSCSPSNPEWNPAAETASCQSVSPSIATDAVPNGHMRRLSASPVPSLPIPAHGAEPNERIARQASDGALHGARIRRQTDGIGRPSPGGLMYVPADTVLETEQLVSEQPVFVFASGHASDVFPAGPRLSDACFPTVPSRGREGLLHASDQQAYSSTRFQWPQQLDQQNFGNKLNLRPGMSRTVGPW
mmetsp:Transcript_24087/g.53111  ORF Transcript_24087/g.53111 Transcript_24087/m.53111 type:complete len:688 (-) Transcript_24087:23-2086(-)